MEMGIGEGAGGEVWTDRRTVPSLSPFPIRSLFLHSPLPIALFPFLSYPLCSLFPALRSLSVPYPFPIFIQESPRFPTWARIRAPLHPFPYPFSHQGVPVRLCFRAKAPLRMHHDMPIYTRICPCGPGWIPVCTPGCAVGSASRYAIACTVACSRMPFGMHAFPDGFPHATACIRPCPPRCTHKCTYGRTPGCTPGHISRCAYGRKPGCALGRILRHPHGHIPTLRPGCTHISVPICRHASWCIGPYAR